MSNDPRKPPKIEPYPHIFFIEGAGLLEPHEVDKPRDASTMITNLRRTLTIEVTLDDKGRVEATLAEHGIKHTGHADSTDTIPAHALIAPLVENAAEAIETTRAAQRRHDG